MYFNINILINLSYGFLFCLSFPAIVRLSTRELSGERLPEIRRIKVWLEDVGGHHLAEAHLHQCTESLGDVIGGLLRGLPE